MLKQVSFTFSVNEFVLVCEKPGVIAPGRSWVFLDNSGCYMYAASNPLSLVYTVVTEWRKGKNLVGWE